MRPPPRPPHAPPAPARWFLLLLLIALGVHAALTGTLAIDVLASRPSDEPIVAELVKVVPLALFVSALLLWRFPRHVPAIVTVTIVIAAAALASPGAVLTVATMLLSAHVVGDRTMAWLGRAGSDGRTHLPPQTCVLIGACIWMGIIAAALPLRIHTLPVYVVILALSLLPFPRTTADAIVTCVRWLARPRDPPAWTERAWVALLIAIALVHLFLVARPEVGYDASAMHLQFAQTLQAQRQWTFDVTRYAWAVMPLGVDLGFAAAYVLDGEAAARVLNFAFGAILLATTYRLIALHARRELALAFTVVIASTPLSFLETSTLYVENLWVAYLLLALLLAFELAREVRSETLCAFAFAAAGAMQCKIIGAIWLAPLCAAALYFAWNERDRWTLDRRVAALLVLATILGSFPYANAWLRTGNPAFPFLNAVFKSQYFEATRSFNNELYNTPLGPGSLYEMILSSGKFIEGADGAAGMQWLLIVAIALVGLFGRRTRAQWLGMGLAALFFIVVYTQQSYLRYVLPALFMLSVFAAWSLEDVRDTRALRVAILLIGGATCIVNLRLIPAASWANATLCLKCAYDDEARTRFTALHSPHRVVSEYLNRAQPNGRVGFFLLNGPSPNGYTGYSRSANWHDWPTYQKLSSPRDAAAVREVARTYRLSHIVYAATDDSLGNDAIRAYAAQSTVPVWRFGDYVVAAIKPE